MYDDDQNAPPINPLPPVVVVLSLMIAGVELAAQAVENGLVDQIFGMRSRLEVLDGYGFSGEALDWMIEAGRYPLEYIKRCVTYLFVHGNFTHALFTTVFILAIGKMVAEVFSTLSFLIIFFASGIVGALAYGLLLDANLLLIGAFPAVYGLIGAMTFMLWVMAKVTGQSQARAFSLIGMLLGIQLFFKLVFGGSNDWVADLTGFATGFILSFALAPNGSERVVAVLNRIRRRR